MIKVVVIDDQALEGKMIAAVAARDCPYVSYEGQAFSAEEGIELTARAKPDIAFLDITMSGMDGIDAIALLRQSRPELSIVMLTAHDDFSHIQRAMRAGANDYLLKPTRPQEISEALERWGRRPPLAEEDPIAAVKRYVEANLEASITLADAAERLHLSPVYFSRLFRNRSGQTFSSWLAQRRIESAKRYLKETRLSIAEIAVKVGYKEANSFTRIFRLATGVPPSEYRKNG